ncbi:OTU-like cysteine protease-domain-containing protein [Clohesyomyces aquaticus]|uniref:OTU-like cysteine protease-domain-containing protein n=1 Tax=Clohesyomyces aquaticus TaxID=1231657 RepID=A0A1Y1ZHA5_9PLEO|nr:OTU-like cysteine protease-domain-containing protein [Clohesyomyces aquaticus]
MAPKRSRSSTPEFPELANHGLYASEIRGDGNCLFSALSDQLYGRPGSHASLRHETVEFMRLNSAHYSMFLEVNPVRRNAPRRRNTPAPLDTTMPSEEQVQQKFEAHLKEMSNTGTWADNLEVSAFASRFNVDITVWRSDGKQTITPDVSLALQYIHSSNGQFSSFSSDDSGTDSASDATDRASPASTSNTSMTSGGGSPKAAAEQRRVLHIAYHNWQHYSSVRKLDGPHDGHPSIGALASVSRKRARPQSEPITRVAATSSSPERDDDAGTVSDNPPNKRRAVRRLSHTRPSTQAEQKPKPKVDLKPKPVVKPNLMGESKPRPMAKTEPAPTVDSSLRPYKTPSKPTYHNALEEYKAARQAKVAAREQAVRGEMSEQPQPQPQKLKLKLRLGPEPIPTIEGPQRVRLTLKASQQHQKSQPPSPNATM